MIITVLKVLYVEYNIPRDISSKGWTDNEVLTQDMIFGHEGKNYVSTPFGQLRLVLV